ncbi:MAG: SIS domain-containing protein [Patescibacteria group bacterium]
MSQTILDNKNEIKKLDSKNMLGSIELFSKQIEQVWNVAKKLKIPAAYKKIDNIAVLGMGGSILGAHVIKELFKKELAQPIEIVSHYNLPAYVNKNTLVIASSYSGTTEEIISAAQEAKARKAKLIVISAGGTLAFWAKKNKIPALVFPTEFNPSNSPRMGLGYSIFGQMAMLSELKLLKIGAKEIDNIKKHIAFYEKEFGVGSPEASNPAKQFAIKLLNKTVWYVASEHLSGSVHIAANQMNENAKRFAGYFIIPELNHHLMEGMLYPEANKQELRFVLLESDLYDKRVQKRYTVTREVLTKNGINYLDYKCVEKKPLGQVCEVLMLSSYVSFYSAMLEGIDPTAIPFVDFFKAQLKK